MSPLNLSGLLGASFVGEGLWRTRKKVLLMTWRLWRDHSKLSGENPRASQLPWWPAEPSGSEPKACYVAEGKVFTNYEPL